MTEPRLTENDVRFRAHELRGLSNTSLAKIVNDRKGVWWTGKAVQEHGRIDFIQSILVDEGFSYEEARKAVNGK